MKGENTLFICMFTLCRTVKQVHFTSQVRYLVIALEINSKITTQKSALSLLLLCSVLKYVSNSWESVSTVHEQRMSVGRGKNRMRTQS